MLNGKFLATLIALLVAVMAICNIGGKKTPIVESFVPNLHTVAQYSWRTADGKSGPVDSSLLYRGMDNCDNNRPAILQANPNFPSSKRIGINYQFPAHAKYSHINPAHLAGGNEVEYGKNFSRNCNCGKSVSAAKIGDMVKESYQEDYNGMGSCSACSNSCGPPAHASTKVANNANLGGSYDAVLSTVPQSGLAELLPVGTLEVCDEEGQCEEAIFNVNYMYSTRRNRLMGLGDMIRGDLPIVPCNDCWFVPSAAKNPSETLQTGAMKALIGDSTIINQQAALSNFGSGGWGAPGGMPDDKPSDYLHSLIESGSLSGQKKIANGNGDVAVYNMPHVYGAAN
jgi:hypothetical protein